MIMMRKFRKLNEDGIGVNWFDFNRACPKCRAYIPKYKRACPNCGQYIKNVQGKVFIAK
jgi:predicted amidophosphoribosyltransferase